MRGNQLGQRRKEYACEKHIKEVKERITMWGRGVRDKSPLRMNRHIKYVMKTLQAQFHCAFGYLGVAMAPPADTGGAGGGPEGGGGALGEVAVRPDNVVV